MKKDAKTYLNTICKEYSIVPPQGNVTTITNFIVAELEKRGLTKTKSDKSFCLIGNC